jgi:choline kinase
MNRFIQKIKKETLDTTIGILSAGIGSRIKSHEPRSLLKIAGKCLLQHQLDTINSIFSNPEIIAGIGVHSNKILRRFNGKLRFVENQLYDSTGSFETLKLIVNNTMGNNLLFFHGDLYFDVNTLSGVDYSKSFVVVDSQQRIREKEVGITVVNNRASILSYGLSIKWCQMAFLTGKEFEILRQMCSRGTVESKTLLTFEAINSIISKGGVMRAHEPEQMSIIEIDCMKDIKHENFDI